MAQIFNGLERVLAELATVRPDWHLDLRGVNDGWYAAINPTADGTSGEYAAYESTPVEAIRRAMALANKA